MLNTDFLFSQMSLQDYHDCPRRFQLRYLRNLAWPAIETEPVEEQENHMQLGVDFHRMVQRHLNGISIEMQMKHVHDGNLERWWRNYQVYRPYDMSGKSYPETALTVTLAGHRLMAKYDVLIVDPGHKMTILDWKTSHSLPSAAYLQQRMQTRVYRYVCAQAGIALFGKQTLGPEFIEMIYWFPEFPESPVRLPYSLEQFHDDQRDLSRLIMEISSLDDGSFRMTTDEKRCKYCRYRSYCGISTQAGVIETFVDEMEDDIMDDILDFDQIAEIEF